MITFKICRDPVTKEEWIETDLRGKELLSFSLLNKGTAFQEEERLELGLLGKLPAHIETLEEQLTRTYLQYRNYNTDLKKHIFLNDLHDKNEILFYHLLSDHISEMMPIVYTPTVSEAVKHFLQEYRQPRGLYIPFEQQDKIETILKNRTNPDVSIILVTDGERILGIGDQGVGGMAIPIAKLILYTLCGGINPYHTLPIMLDVGTDNHMLLDNPLYLGWRHERVRGEAYDVFIDKFVTAVKKLFPKVYLHWEDFGRDNARRILEKYRHKLCTFNDDMQGTGCVTLAALLSAVSRKGERLSQQNFVIFGAGTAGAGIADQILDALQREGLSEQEALSRLWLVDKEGLLSETMKLMPFQQKYARKEGGLSLISVIQTAKPSVLIGCSGVSGAFNENLVRTLKSYCESPIILPLSNPNEFSEADPSDLLRWTEGKGLIATGSPFKVPVAQCNNALVFPGIGLGVIASQAKCVTDKMLWEACQTLAEYSPKREDEPILPQLSEAKKIAAKVALAVALAAFDEDVAGIERPDDLNVLIRETMWDPVYRTIKPSNGK